MGDNSTVINSNDLIDNKLKEEIVQQIEWDEINSIELINYVEVFENLWNTNSKEYNNKDTDKSWDSVAQLMKLPKIEVMDRWNCMKGYYLAYKRRLDENKSGRFSETQNRLILEMYFLDELQIIPRKSKSNKDPVPTSTDSSDNEPVSSKVKRFKKSHQRNYSQGTKLTNMMNNAFEVILKNRQTTDEWGALGDLVSSNARNWSLVNIDFARKYKAAVSAVNAQFDLEAIEMFNDLENNK